MSKKKNKNKDGDQMVDSELYIIYGSLNGWLKIVDSQGEETIFRPSEHSIRDEPATWYSIGDYYCTKSITD